MKRLALSIISIGAIVYLSMCAFLYFYQDHLLYHPKGRSVTAEQHTWLMPTDAGNTVVTVNRKEGAKALIYFGGNGEDVSLNLEKFQNTFSDYALYLMHYRGYGGSDGKPGESSIYKDATALYEHVAGQHTEIVLMGRSLGTGVATRLAAEKPAGKLILITPYSSIEELASDIYWGFPVSLLIKDRYPSADYAAEIAEPTAIFLAGRDTVIPLENSMKLIKRFKKGVATIYTFPTANHNRISSEPDYHGLLKQITE